MGGLGSDSLAILIGHKVAYCSPLLHLQRFFSVVRSCVGQAFSSRNEPHHSLHTFNVIRDNSEDFFLKTYLHFLMTLECTTFILILHIHKINLMREMSLNLIKIALI